jgi:hypothetical protein
MELTKKQKWMLNYVREHSNYADKVTEYVSPTQVGNAYGVFKGKYYHSSIASPTLLELTQMGLLIRNDKGHYKFKK